MALASDEFVAKEAYYHGTCYRVYTVILKNVPKGCIDETPLCDTEKAFVELKHYLLELYQTPDIIQYTEVKQKYKTSLKRYESVTDTEIFNLKKTVAGKLNQHSMVLIFLRLTNGCSYFQIHFKWKTLSKD